MIAANESHPDFLLQLLKRLKQVKSDQQRVQTLHSLQNLHGVEIQERSSDNATEDYRELLSNLWRPTRNPRRNSYAVSTYEPN